MSSSLTPAYSRPKCPSSGKLKLSAREAKVIVRRMRSDGSDAGIYRCRECKSLHVASSVSLERGYRGRKQDKEEGAVVDWVEGETAVDDDVITGSEVRNDP